MIVNASKAKRAPADGFVRSSSAHHGQYARLNKQAKCQNNKQSTQYKANCFPVPIHLSTATTAAMRPIQTKLITPAMLGNIMAAIITTHVTGTVRHPAATAASPHPSAARQ
jgi:hypothetical protein